jgi:hypothetical protein
MRKNIFPTIFLLPLVLALGLSRVSAEPLPKLSFHSKLNSTNSEDHSQNSRNAKIAQATTSSELAATNQPIGWSQRNFATPDSPASKLIGSSPSTIPNISTPGALAANLLNGFNSDGKFVTGIAIDTVPYLLFRGPGITLEEYRKNEGLEQFLSNLSLSIATDKETSSETARVGIAAQFTILNQGDRRIDPEYSKVLNSFAKLITEDIAFVDSLKDLTAEQRNQAIATKYKKWQESPCEIDPTTKEEKPCFAREINRLEKKPIWTVAVGSSFITPNGRYSDLRGDGMGIWSTYRQGIGGNTQLIFHTAYRSGERITDSQGAFFNGDTFLLGTRLRMGDETNSRFSLEAAYNLENRQGNSSNSYLTLGVGLEQKFIPQENLWFLFSFTAEPGRQNGSDFRFNSGVKWEFGSPGSI